MSEITTLDVYAIGAPLIVLMILAESLVSSWRGHDYYHSQDNLATIGLLIGNFTVTALVKGLVVATYFYFYQFRIFDLALHLPVWVQWVLAFLAIDLVFYVYHRMSHRVRFMWAVHMSHHSSEQMNFGVSFRQAWFGPLNKLPFFMSLPLVGFDPSMTVVAGAISTLWGVVGHTQWVKRLGPLEWIMNTPSHHRVHHGSNPEYLDKNYGNLLIIWDRLFGTFQREEAPVVYGLVKNVATYNPVTISFMDWLALFSEMRRAPNVKSAAAHFFGPPDHQIR